MQTIPNRPPSITRKTRLTSIIRLTRPTSLNRLESITSTTGKNRLTKLGRKTSYTGHLYLKGRGGLPEFLGRMVIAKLIIPVRVVFLGILRILFIGAAISHG